MKPEIEKLIEEARQDYDREQELARERAEQAQQESAQKEQELKERVLACARVLVPPELHDYIHVTGCDSPDKEFVVTGADGLGDIVCRFADSGSEMSNIVWWAKKYKFEWLKDDFYLQITRNGSREIQETLVECDSFKHAVIIAAGPDFVGSWERALAKQQEVKEYQAKLQREKNAADQSDADWLRADREFLAEQAQKHIAQGGSVTENPDGTVAFHAIPKKSMIEKLWEKFLNLFGGGE